MAEELYQDKSGRYLRRCVWCGTPCYGTVCREHRILEDRLREFYKGNTTKGAER